ncbi:MAG: GNAT family N-acetyltransferase [Firmicutes bacterium]|nr:GNAT family N-acetyltransferase [Bacillota bacterium]
MIEIKETTIDDLKNVQSLWADGEVMKFVGFPDGLHQTDEEMIEWLRWIDSMRPMGDHFSVYEDGVYCGESFYEIVKEDNYRARMDIKLFPAARGRGIAFKALKHAIDRAFANGAKKCYVVPDPRNERALALYRRLGMTQKEIPEELFDADYPDSMYFEIER